MGKKKSNDLSKYPNLIYKKHKMNIINCLDFNA